VNGAGHTKVMSTLHTIKFGGEVVHKDRYASTGAFSLNGHDSSNIMPAKKAVLKVPTLGRKPTNMPSTDIFPFTNATAGQKNGIKQQQQPPPPPQLHHHTNTSPP